MRLPKNLLSDTYKKPSVYLCQTNKDRIGELIVHNFEGAFKWNTYSEISFDIDRMYCDVNTGETLINPYYDLVEGLRLVYVEGFGYFQLQDPEIDNDGIIETKSINANSSEYDLSNRYLESFIINKGIDGSIDGVQLYNQNDPSHSLLHLIIAEKAIDWKIGHVDAVLATQRRFFEIDRMSVYDFIMNEMCPTFKCVVIFDTIDNTINVYAEETAGEDTDVVITFENLANEINVKYTADDIKTVLTVTGAEELNIREVNYGLPYITDLSYYHTIGWMGEHLYNSYNEYLKVLSSYQQQYLDLATEKRKLSDKISDYKYHTSVNINNVKIKHFENFLIDLYKDNELKEDTITEIDSDFEYLKETTEWTNFKSTIGNKDSTEEAKDTAIASVLNLIWQEYSLTNLKMHETLYKEKQTAEVEGDMSNKENDNYYQYHATFMMLDSCQKVINQKNELINSVQKVLDVVNADILTISEAISMKNNFTEEDIIRLAPFLREDEYNDENFVVTESSSEEEIYETKIELLNAGYTELHKLSRPKLSFTTSIANVFALSEFNPIINQFQLGNMIQIELRPDYIKKSRLMEIDINFDDFDDFDVTFGDLLSIKDESDIHADLLSQAINAGKSVAKNSYTWQKGSDNANSMQEAINKGLLDEATEIKSIDGTQSVSIDKYGIHLRKVVDGEIDKEQGWIVSNKFLYTDDNWKTTKSVFGKYQYKDGERWGILAEAVVGGYIKGTEIEGGSLKIGNRGDGTYALVVNADGTVQINEWGGELSEKIENIESMNYNVIVSASTTPIFNESVQNTTLTCTIYQNNVELTSIPAGTTYSWIRTSSDPTGDATWNSSHANLTVNTLSLTGADIEHSAQFSCEVNIL